MKNLSRQNPNRDGHRPLNLIVALTCEAKPLIQYYRLKKRSDSHVFPIYENETIRLCVCGVGKLAAASAVSYLAGMTYGVDSQEGPSIWLNIGVAGHASLDIGQAVLVSKIVDSATQKSYYPTVLDFNLLPTTQLRSVDSVETQYHLDSAYDMEAAGFIHAASRYSVVELIQCFKVISDNCVSSLKALDKEKIAALIADNCGHLDKLLPILSALRDQVSVSGSLNRCSDMILSQWHFTTAQSHRLRDLVQRCLAFDAGAHFEGMDWSQFSDARSILNYLDHWLAGQIMDLSE